MRVANDDRMLQIFQILAIVGSGILVLIGGGYAFGKLEGKFDSAIAVLQNEFGNLSDRVQDVTTEVKQNRISEENSLNEIRKTIEQK